MEEGERNGGEGVKGVGNRGREEGWRGERGCEKRLGIGVEERELKEWGTEVGKKGGGEGWGERGCEKRLGIGWE